MTQRHAARGALLVALAAVAASAVAQDRRDESRNRPITITGCVRAGVESGTFMLMNVREMDVANRVQGVPVDEFGRDVLYILNSAKGLDKAVGRRVVVTGTVDLSDSHKTRMKVIDDPTKRKDQNIEIRGDGEKVTVESDTAPRVAPDAAGSVTTSTEPNREMYRIDVKSIRAVSRSPCVDRAVIFRRVPPS